MREWEVRDGSKDEREHQSRWEKVSVDDSKLRQVKNMWAGEQERKWWEFHWNQSKKHGRIAQIFLISSAQRDENEKKSRNRDNGKSQKNKWVEKRKSLETTPWLSTLSKSYDTLRFNCHKNKMGLERWVALGKIRSIYQALQIRGLLHSWYWQKTVAPRA